MYLVSKINEKKLALYLKLVYIMVVDSNGNEIENNEVGKMKLGDKRKSRSCPRFCDGVGCYDIVIKLPIGLAPLGMGFVSKCKTHERICAKVKRSIKNK